MSAAYEPPHGPPEFPPGRPPLQPIVPRWSPLQPGRPEPARSPLPGFPFVAPPPTLGDAEDRLRERGILLLSGFLDGAAAQRAAAALMLLDAEHDGPVRLHLGCPDGDLDGALLLAETVDLLTLDTTALVTGVLGGPVLAVLAAAGRREAHRHALIRLQEPTGSAAGRADRLAADAEQHARQVAQLHERLAGATGRDAGEIAADLRAGRLLSAEQAVDYGLLDAVRPGRR